MRIALAAGSTFPLPPFFGGGSQRHVWGLATEFAKKGIQCELISIKPREEIACKIPEGISMNYVEPKKSGVPLLSELNYAKSVNEKLEEIHAGKKLGMVHAHSTYAGFGAMKFCSAKKIPFAFTQHNWRTLDYKPENLREKIRQLIDLHFVEKKVISGADKNFFVCNYIMDKTREKTGLSEKNWFVTPNGVDAKEFNTKNSPTKFLKKYGLKKSDFVVCSAGRLAPEKNNLGLIRAFSGFAEKNKSARLFVAGSGPERKMLENIVVRLGMQNRIVLTGNLGLDDLKSLFAASKVFVLPSYHECLPVSMLEAMASGSAVIASRAGGIPEVLQNWQNGLLLDSAKSPAEIKNKISLLYRNKNLRKTLAKNAVETIRKKYSWKRIADAALKAYKVQ